MEDFFSFEETKGKIHQRAVRGCKACKLDRNCRNPKQDAFGKGKNGIMIVGRSPAESERLLSRTLAKAGVRLDDCIKTHALACQPSEDATKKQLAKAVDLCRPGVLADIKEHKPKIIIPLGPDALYTVIGNHYGAIGPFSKWRGWQIPDREHQSWICPVFHPAYVHQRERATYGVAKRLFRQDLRSALKCGPFESLDMDIEVLEKPKAIIRFLKSLKKEHPIAFDIEGTGLKPYREEHDIRTVAIADTYSHGVSFPLLDEVVPAFCRVMENKRIPKIMHNVKFEALWCEEVLDCVIQNIIWDTMLVAHTLNNAKVSSLKFQAYANFGHPDYSKAIDKYLKAKNSESANDLNTVFKAPLFDLCLYNGKDAVLAFAVAMKQMKELGYAF